MIGRGGMGIVVGARHIDLGRDVALKFLCYGEGSTATGEFRARFRREAQIDAKLRNEHITRVLDTGVFQNSSYIVMERLEGENLRKRIKVAGGSLALQHALNYTLQLCEGIAEAHAPGIVHRDLKPANLFSRSAPDGARSHQGARLRHLEVRKDQRDGGLTKTARSSARPSTCRPSRSSASKTVDARADIWSLGAILYELLSGRTPYNENTLARFCAAVMAGPPPRLDELKPEIPSRVADAVARCFERDPNARTASVAALAGELLEAVDAPGNTLRERLAIISMRPVEGRGHDAVPNSTSGSYLAAKGPTSQPGQEASVSQTKGGLVSTNPTLGSPAGVAPVVIPPAKSRWPVVAVLLVAFIGGGVAANSVLGRRGTASATPAEASAAAGAAQPPAAKTSEPTPTASTPTVTVDPSASASATASEEPAKSAAPAAAPAPAAPVYAPRRVHVAPPPPPPPAASPPKAPEPPAATKVQGRVIRTEF